MATSETTRVNGQQHRVTQLADNVSRLQVARRARSFTDDSWMVINRDLEQAPTTSQPGAPPSAPATTGLYTILLGEDGVEFSFPLEDDDLVFGLGQGTGALNRRDTKKEVWNIDVLGHASCIHPNLRNLYQSVPFAIVLRHGRATGYFWDYAGRQHWDFCESSLKAGGPAKSLDLYIFSGPTLADILDRFTQLTGRPALPPRWALGYQQSRYSYASREELEAIAAEFRTREIPCDVLYLDIDHLDGYRVFTFGESFPRPKQMIEELRGHGFKLSAIADPGVKNDPKFDLLKRGRAAKAFVRKPRSRADFIGKVWPGPARFPDFTHAKARRWWAGEQARHQRKYRLAGYWNDMNEPAIFDGPGKTLPEDCVHQSDHGRIKHGELHNIYGTQMARASHEGALKANPNHRPFIVSRGGSAGIQRFGAVWTGDNSSCWEHLSESIPMLLNLGLSGIPFCGADVGGFLDDCSGELLARWTQLGAFTPFFRNHSNTGVRAQEPWAFGSEIEIICRAYINLRYQLLPYLYAAFAEAHRAGMPIMRPLVWHHSNDPKAAKCSDQFLLGEHLLVAPVVQKDATARSVYLPRGIWFDFWSGAAIEGGQHIVQEVSLSSCPLFIRGGGIIPMAAPRQFIDPAKPDEEITLHLWLGGRGDFMWYEDDGESLAFRNGAFSQRQLHVADLGDRGFLRFEAVQGRRRSRVKIWRIVIHGVADKFQFAANETPFEPTYDEVTGIVSFLLENDPGDFEIRWHV